MITATASGETTRAWQIAAEVVDPELPILTLADLGVLRQVEVVEGALIVTITPTYSGCPAMAEMRADLIRRLRAAGYEDVRVEVALQPAWTTDWITPAGKAALLKAGVSAPRPLVDRGSVIPLQLAPIRRQLTCPRCSSSDIDLVSEFASTACKALYRCLACSEPFDHLKEI